MVDGLIPNKFPTAGGGGGADEDAFLLNVPEDVWESRRRPVGQSGDLPPPLFAQLDTLFIDSLMARD